MSQARRRQPGSDNTGVLIAQALELVTNDPLTARRLMKPIALALRIIANDVEKQARRDVLARLPTHLADLHRMTYHSAKQAFLRNLLQARLCLHDGNVRAAARSLHIDRTQLYHLLKSLRVTPRSSPAARPRAVPQPQGGATMEQILHTTRKELLLSRLTEHDGNVRRAAESLGMSKTNFHRYLAAYGITHTEPPPRVRQPARQATPPKAARRQGRPSVRT